MLDLFYFISSKVLKLKKLLLLAPYCSLPEEKKFNRFLYLAGVLSLKYDVTLVTSNFRHYDKQHRNADLPEQKFKIVKINEPGYKNNVSLKRVYSHRVFLKNFIEWFSNNRHSFEIIYSAYPLISTNVFLAKNKKSLSYKLIIDIQDIWPEAIASAYPIFTSIPNFLLPFTKQANYCYKNADGIVAVSQTYLERALKVSNSKFKKVLYIGSDIAQIESAEPAQLNSERVKLIYIGSLGYSYDVKTVLRAVNNLSNNGIRIELHIVGGGSQEKELRALADKNIIFHGFVDFKKMVKLVKACDLGVNSLIASAPQSITNKLSDYFSIGIPILNSQTNKELLNLLQHHDHINYLAGNVKSCEEAIQRFIDLKDTMYFKPKKAFFRQNTYPEMIKFIADL